VALGGFGGWIELDGQRPGSLNGPTREPLRKTERTQGDKGDKRAMFAVVITEKSGGQRRMEFDKNEVTIGRVQGNDIILPKGNVSKRHSRIVLKDNRFIVVDLKSTNGTYVNGRKITSPLVVKPGDKVYIGDFIMNVEELVAVAGAPQAMQSGPPPLGPSAGASSLGAP